MTTKRVQFFTSDKTVSSDEPVRRTVTRQSSFRSEDDPAAAPIRDPTRTSHDVTEPEDQADTMTSTTNTIDPVLNDTTSAEEETASTSFNTQQQSGTHTLDCARANNATRTEWHGDDPAGSLHPARVGDFLAQLTVRWHNTFDELIMTYRHAIDQSLPQEIQVWCRSRYVQLEERERSLRESIHRLTPLPMEPHLRAYQEALTAHAEANRAYLSEATRAYLSEATRAYLSPRRP